MFILNGLHTRALQLRRQAWFIFVERRFGRIGSSDAQKYFYVLPFLIVIFFLPLSLPLYSQQLKLVKNFNLTGNSYTYDAFSNGNVIFLNTNDSSTFGTEIWVSNNDLDSTFLLKDINPGASGSDPFVLGIVGSRLIFFALDSTGKKNLWSSDGTPSGTIKISQIEQFSNQTSDFCITDSLIYFVAYDIQYGNEIWVTDGTITGTHLTKDVRPGPLSFCNSNFQLFGLDNRLFFAANDGIHNNDLWVSDGTEIGTHLIVDIDSSNMNFVDIHGLTGLAHKVYFVYNNSIFKTDGTASGTSLVQMFSVYQPATQIFSFKNWIIYQLTASTPTGPIASLGIIDSSFCQLPYISYSNSEFYNLRFIGDSTFYFFPYSNMTGSFHSSDGTALHTKDLGFEYVTPWNTSIFGSRLVFGHELDASTGYELNIVEPQINIINTLDIISGPVSSYPHHLTIIGDKLFFIAKDSLKGFQLFVTKGNSTNTQVLMPANANQNALQAFGDGHLPHVKNILFVNANYDSIGTELYYLDANIPLEINDNNLIEVTSNEVFPNPSHSGHFTISNSSKVDRIIVYNEMQQKILEKECVSDFDLSNFSNGLYYLTIIDGNSISTKTLIKN